MYEIELKAWVDDIPATEEKIKIYGSADFMPATPNKRKLYQKRK